MPPGPTALQQAGARPSAEPKGAPLFNDRFFTGLWTQRNILRDPSGVVTERWYGGRPDALLDGLNVELTNRLTLARAPGSTAYSSATLSQGVNSFYSFKQFGTSTETITVMADTPAVLYAINPTSKTTVLTKAPGAGASFLIGAGNVLYIGDGVEQQAWTPLGGLRNWGVGRGGGAASSAAYAGAGSSVASGGGAAWSNPGNATGAPDLAYATATGPGGNAATDYLRLTTYAISLAGSLGGIQIAITLKVSANVFGNLLNAQLTLNGNRVGVAKVQRLLGAGPFTITLGGPNDLWGTNLTSAQVSVNNANFGVDIWATPFSSILFSVDAAQITGYQTGTPPTVALVAGGFSPAPATGYKYVVAYANGSNTVVGQASIPSALIKPDATHSVQVSLVASTDPQVTQIYVFRTLDGGATYYNLPSSPYPNTTGNITDSAADSTLQLFQQADLNGLNTPPPFGFTAFEFHMGHIWGAVGNTLYYSVGSDLGLILGNGNEGFPPANFFTFPSAITRLLSLSTVAGAGLIVFTTSDVYVILGNGTALAVLNGATGITVFYAAPLLKKVGLPNYNALDARGAIVYMMTNDGRVISFNPNSQIIYTDPEKALNEIGFAIGAPPPASSITLTGGTLASFTPSSTYVSWHGAGSADQALYVSDGSTGWFRCNPNQQPDGGAVWSAKRNIVGGCSAVQSIETSPGVYQLLIGPPSSGGSVLYRDPTVFADNTSAYSAKARFGANVLAHPGQVANPEFVTCDFAAVGSQPTVQVLFDELDAAFTTLSVTTQDPPQLTAPSSVFANRYDVRQAASGTQIPAACRYMQLWVDFGNTDTVQNEILTLCPFGSYEQEA
ncbi:MAG TPA: hypothetical protein VNU44_14565 [Bryobacteraceae bacterium]|jgi:hypothetical protein|nr:hypothetical protein [Bryobacteraceae bacterium]